MLVKRTLSEGPPDTRRIQDELQRRVECISSVISIGVSYSNHFPQERMRMKIVDARSRLQSAKDTLLGTRNRRNLPSRALMVTEAWLPKVDYNQKNKSPPNEVLRIEL